MLSSPEDGIIVDLNSKEDIKEKDIQAGDNINEINSLTYEAEDENFYVMCNKYREQLGFFILKIHSKPPYRSTFLIKWKSKLDISDTSMYVLTNETNGYKELILGFKNIYVNTYNIFCIDIS